VVDLNVLALGDYDVVLGTQWLYIGPNSMGFQEVNNGVYLEWETSFASKVKAL